MPRSPHISIYACVLMLMASTACSKKSADDHVWDNHHDVEQTYIDNDEYYVAPTGGYVTGATGGILDAD